MDLLFGNSFGFGVSRIRPDRTNSDWFLPEPKLRPTNPKRLSTLASRAKYPGGNTILHKFVLDNSHPNNSGNENYINGILMSMAEVAVYSPNDDGHTALHLAVLKNNLLMVKKLLSCLQYRSINTYAARKFALHKNTALHLAAELGHASIIEELLKAGANIHARNGDDNTALGIAVKSHTSYVMKMLASEVSNIDPTSPPLNYATYSGNLEAIEVLLSNGGELHAADDYGYTPLHHAVHGGELTRAELSRCKGAELHAADGEGEAPSQYPTCRNGVERTELCETNVYNHQARAEREEDKIPLHRTICRITLACAKLLIDKGADLHAIDNKGRTPLHHAIRWNFLALAELLINRGADLNAVDDKGKTPLHYAICWNFSELAELLTNRGADLNAADEEGKTPLHHAICGEYLACAKLLISKGADPRAVDKEGKTPLHYAIRREFLVRAGLLDDLK